MRRLKPSVLEYLQGYALANEFMQIERMERLARMTPDESAAIYDHLCEIWYQSGRKAGGNLDALDELQIRAHLAQRRAFDLCAKSRGLA
jgi:hypothetical protein